MHSLKKSFRLFLLELSCLLKESVDLKKNYYKMSFSIVPSNLGDTVKETDKDMNNTKSSILPMQITPNKKYVDEKTETIHFLSKYVGRSLFVETFIKKATCWYHTDHNSNSDVHHQNKFVSLLSIY